VKQVILLVGLGYGDEGKGTITDYLTRKFNAPLVVRYNGGAQAGHNVVTPEGKHHCFSQFGSGTFAGAGTYLSHFMVVNPLSLMNEAAGLQRVGISDPFEKLTVDKDALAITPFHVVANRLKELLRGSYRHGSCGMGVGQARRDLFENKAVLHVGDLTDPAKCRELLEQQLAEKLAEFKEPVAKKIEELKHVVELFPRLRDQAKQSIEEFEREMNVLSGSETINRILEGFARFTKSVKVVGRDWFFREKAKDQTIIFEGAQGVLLDETYGFQPHTTWTDITFKNAYDVLDFWSYGGSVKRLGIIRTFQTRHGAGPLVTEDFDLAPLARDDHNRANEWQQSFRTGYLDLVATRYAIKVLGGIDGLCVTHLDKVKDNTKVCLAYRGISSENRELFSDVHGQTSLQIRVPKPTGDIWQDFESGKKITHALREVEPVLVDVGASAVFPSEVARELETPLYVQSKGPTSQDKIFHGDS
jgi:adenylosuccinate synthase